ncbi:uncharacterized protein H6S33_000866 [Morchella sextelata]|uniref:uncharacterized protein n=1 Tax=Morchella sextelata TaxID=1174677 RepID=UPI001D0529E4|nr:uncharacterized protein H6S33_000866 [Morchella sextelata]KAH0615230.1 hypothetical protein H6S33_000866 [Morchella sextelata]
MEKRRTEKFMITGSDEFLCKSQEALQDSLNLEAFRVYDAWAKFELYSTSEVSRCICAHKAEVCGLQGR